MIIATRNNSNLSKRHSGVGCTSHLTIAPVNCLQVGRKEHGVRPGQQKTIQQRSTDSFQRVADFSGSPFLRKPTPCGVYRKSELVVVLEAVILQQGYFKANQALVENYSENMSSSECLRRC